MTDKKEPLFTVDLGENGGIIVAASFEHFLKMATEERDKWTWLAESASSEVPQAIAEQVLSRLEGVVQYATNMSDGQTLEGYDPVGVLRNHYASAIPTIFHSNGTTGRAISSIRDKLGNEEGARVQGILGGQIAFNYQDVRHLRVMMLAANPALIDSAATHAVAERYLADFQRDAQTTRAEQISLLTTSADDWEQFQEAAADRLATARHRFMQTGLRGARRLKAASAAAIEEIHRTRAAYESQMQLQSAVQYWGEKRAAHAKERSTAFIHLRRWVIFASAFALATFLLATIVMLEASGVNVFDWLSIEPSPGRTIAAAAYLIISAGVGSILTALFWATRLLVRIYFTARRSEADAEERRVMTQTYLALIKTGAAQEQDRLIILNALFRPGADGGGSDDGGGDVALPALIAKLLDQRSAR
jgi:hypothetical protein